MPRGVPVSGKRQPRTYPDLPEVSVERVYDELEEQPELVEEALIEEPPVEAPVIDTSRPDDELSPQELEIKALRDRLARETGRKDVEPEVQEPTLPGDSNNIVIHILEDGVTMLGKVWYRGQELEFEPGSRAYKDTFDRLGRSWLELRHNEFAQAERWGKVLFRSGPWPGKTYADGTFETIRSEDKQSFIKPPSAEELAAAEKARARRAAPHLPVR